MVRLVEARYVSGYLIWVRFSDALAGEVGLSDELEGEIFEPLRDSTFFQSFVLHPELHTLVWPNGPDFAPEFLHDLVRVQV
jgi:hypothetical protein